MLEAWSLVIYLALPGQSATTFRWTGIVDQAYCEQLSKAISAQNGHVFCVLEKKPGSDPVPPAIPQSKKERKS